MEEPAFCRSCGALALLSWKLLRPRFSIELITPEIGFLSTRPELFEVGWCEGCWKPMPADPMEVVRIVTELGVATYTFDPGVEEVIRANAKK